MPNTWVSIEQEFTIYVAGFFDGEGCIAIGKEPNGLRRIHLAIAQKNLTILEAIQNRWGGSIGKPQRNCYYLRIQGANDVVRFLTSVSPYLRLKEKEAEIALAVVLITNSREPQHIYLREKMMDLLQEVSDARRKEEFECQNPTEQSHSIARVS